MLPTMDAEDFIEPHALSKSGYASEGDGPRVSGGNAGSVLLSCEGKNEINGVASEAMPYDTSDEALETECIPVTDSSNVNKKTHVPTGIKMNSVNNTPMAVDFEMTESVAVVNEVTSYCSMNTKIVNGLVAVEGEGILSNHKKIETINCGPISGVKRPRMTVDEDQPSVHVIFNSLTRESKRKLQELLQQWSQWHAQNCSSSNDSSTVMESGEVTYFPALHVGSDKPSQVTFWVDNQTKIQSNKEFIPLEDMSVPLYDREYSLALTSGADSNMNGMEKLGASRCFNCGSYSHALKDCSKPRDNAAVNSARKQHNSQRNQNANFRNSVRYYQSTPGGKYDGLTPGALDPETRKVLGVGELDPPPWLNRMRELGYPPGYLDFEEEEDQPSGITIFDDEPNKEEEGGKDKIHSASSSNPTRKKRVKFPGINAPIPGKAKPLLWAATSSSATLSRDHSPREYNNHPLLNFSQVNHHRLMFSGNLNYEQPPGCGMSTSPSLSSPFRQPPVLPPPHSLGSPPAWSPNMGRPLSDRGWRSPLAQDSNIVYPKYGRYGTYPYPSRR